MSRQVPDMGGADSGSASAPVGSESNPIHIDPVVVYPNRRRDTLLQIPGEYYYRNVGLFRYAYNYMRSIGDEEAANTIFMKRYDYQRTQWAKGIYTGIGLTVAVVLATELAVAAISSPGAAVLGGKILTAGGNAARAGSAAANTINRASTAAYFNAVRHSNIIANSATAFGGRVLTAGVSTYGTVANFVNQTGTAAYLNAARYSNAAANAVTAFGGRVMTTSAYVYGASANFVNQAGLTAYFAYLRYTPHVVKTAKAFWAAYKAYGGARMGVNAIQQALNNEEGWRGIDVISVLSERIPGGATTWRKIAGITNGVGTTFFEWRPFLPSDHPYYFKSIHNKDWSEIFYDAGSEAIRSGIYQFGIMPSIGNYSEESIEIMHGVISREVSKQVEDTYFNKEP